MQVLLVGQPNVGKSVIMNALTGAGAVVSNYPGTTVDVTRGFLHGTSRVVEVIDTPGTYTLHSDTEEQRVTQRLLIEGSPDVIVDVVDATNLARNLYLTLQLTDFDVPTVLALNQVDRAKQLGLEIDAGVIERELGIPVVPLIAVSGKGIEQLKQAILTGARRGRRYSFSDALEGMVERLAVEIRGTVPSDRLAQLRHPERALAMHLLEHDEVDRSILGAFPGLERLVEALHEEMRKEGLHCANCYRDCRFCPARLGGHPAFLTCVERTTIAKRIAGDATRILPQPKPAVEQKLEDILDQPFTGIPLLGIVAYLCFRGIMLSVDVFERLAEAASPYLQRLVGAILSLLPLGSFKGVLTEAVTEGLTLPFSVVMPAMLSVNLAIALLEDSGLMPRIAVAMDKATSVIGLRGQSIIPILLGFGCRAPAIMATRVLQDRRERLIAATLIGIVVPCAASLGIITGLIARSGADATIVVASMALAFVATGLLLGRRLAGHRDEFLAEVPPVRLPVLSNVWAKTRMRFGGFFVQVMPLLVGTSVVVRLLMEARWLESLAAISRFTIPYFGVRGEVFAGIAVTTLQRYLAPMVLLNLPLTPREATIACTMVALSYPCLPVSVLITKEIGWRSLLTVLIIATVLPLSAGIVLNTLLP